MIKTRYTPPSRLTQEPYGTIVNVISTEANVAWVQTSPKLKHPKWKPVGMLLSDVFSKHLSNDNTSVEEFIHACLLVVENKSPGCMKVLLDIIKRKENL